MPDEIAANDEFLREGSTDPAQVQDYYDAMAADYDATLSSWSYQAPNRVAALLVEHGHDLRRVLDAGCGTGLAGSALRAHGYSGALHGVDVSPASLLEAERRGIYESLQFADLQQRLPFEDSVFDAIVCVGVLTYVPDVDACLREFCRVATAGAMVVFTQRDDVWQERDCAAVVEGLERDGLWHRVLVSEPSAYMPDHSGLGDILVRYVACRTAVG